MAVRREKGNLPHIWWIDLKNNGTYVECAVMREDQFGNLSYFALTSLDDIDKRRLQRIVANRNATNFELWDLMSNITLNNGVNALDYFHQLVKVITPSGQVHRPTEGVIGVGDRGIINTRTEDQKQRNAENTQAVANAAANAAATAAVAAMQSQMEAQMKPTAQPTQLNESASDPAPAAKKKVVKKKATT